MSVLLYGFVSVVIGIVGAVSDSERRFGLRFKSMFVDGEDVGFDDTLSAAVPRIDR